MIVLPISYYFELCLLSVLSVVILSVCLIGCVKRKGPITNNNSQLNSGQQKNQDIEVSLHELDINLNNRQNGHDRALPELPIPPSDRLSLVDDEIELVESSIYDVIPKENKNEIISIENTDENNFDITSKLKKTSDVIIENYFESQRHAYEKVHGDMDADSSMYGPPSRDPLYAGIKDLESNQSSSNKLNITYIDQETLLEESMNRNIMIDSSSNNQSKSKINVPTSKMMLAVEEDIHIDYPSPLSSNPSPLLPPRNFTDIPQLQQSYPLETNNHQTNLSSTEINSVDENNISTNNGCVLLPSYLQLTDVKDSIDSMKFLKSNASLTIKSDNLPEECIQTINQLNSKSDKIYAKNDNLSSLHFPIKEEKYAIVNKKNRKSRSNWFIPKDSKLPSYELKYSGNENFRNLRNKNFLNARKEKLKFIGKKRGSFGMEHNCHRPSFLSNSHDYFLTPDLNDFRQVEKRLTSSLGSNSVLMGDQYTKINESLVENHFPNKNNDYNNERLNCELKCHGLNELNFEDIDSRFNDNFIIGQSQKYSKIGNNSNRRSNDKDVNIKNPNNVRNVPINIRDRPINISNPRDSNSKNPNLRNVTIKNSIVNHLGDVTKNNSNAFTTELVNNFNNPFLNNNDEVSSVAIRNPRNRISGEEIGIYNDLDDSTLEINDVRNLMSNTQSENLSMVTSQAMGRVPEYSIVTARESLESLRKRQALVMTSKRFKNNLERCEENYDTINYDFIKYGNSSSISSNSQSMQIYSYPVLSTSRSTDNINTYNIGSDLYAEIGTGQNSSRSSMYARVSDIVNIVQLPPPLPSLTIPVTTAISLSDSSPSQHQDFPNYSPPLNNGADNQNIRTNNNSVNKSHHIFANLEFHTSIIFTGNNINKRCLALNDKTNVNSSLPLIEPCDFNSLSLVKQNNDNTRSLEEPVNNINTFSTVLNINSKLQTRHFNKVIREYSQIEGDPGGYMHSDILTDTSSNSNYPKVCNVGSLSVKNCSMGEVNLKSSLEKDNVNSEVERKEEVFDNDKKNLNSLEVEQKTCDNISNTTNNNYSIIDKTNLILATDILMNKNFVYNVKNDRLKYMIAGDDIILKNKDSTYNVINENFINSPISRDGGNFIEIKDSTYYVINDNLTSNVLNDYNMNFLTNNNSMYNIINENVTSTISSESDNNFLIYKNSTYNVISDNLTSIICSEGVSNLLKNENSTYNFINDNVTSTTYSEDVSNFSVNKNSLFNVINEDSSEESFLSKDLKIFKKKITEHTNAFDVDQFNENVSNLCIKQEDSSNDIIYSVVKKLLTTKLPLDIKIMKNDKNYRDISINKNNNRINKNNNRLDINETSNNDCTRSQSNNFQIDKTYDSSYMLNDSKIFINDELKSGFSKTNVNIHRPIVAGNYYNRNKLGNTEKNFKNIIITNKANDNIDDYIAVKTEINDLESISFRNDIENRINPSERVSFNKQKANCMNNWSNKDRKNLLYNGFEPINWLSNSDGIYSNPNEKNKKYLNKF